MMHSFDSKIAEKYGIEKAVLLHFFCYWIEKNRANNKHFHDGKYWTYNTGDAFLKMFPYLKSRQKIARLLREMTAENLIEVANYNKLKQDQTKWYALTQLAINLLYGQVDNEINNGDENLNNECSKENRQCSNLNNDECSNLNNDNKETVNNQLTNNSYKKTNKKKSDQKFSLITELKKLGVSEQLASDWQKVRKAKRLVETQTAFNGFIKQVGQSGLSVSEAVELCINRGWGGFDARWLANTNAPFGNRPTGQPISANTNADGISEHHYSDLDLSQFQAAETPEEIDVPF